MGPGARLRVGYIEVLALDDGVMYVPPSFYVGLDAERHAGMVEADGAVHAPIGCFLLRSGGRTVLVDTGVGDVPMRNVSGGRLLHLLAGAGVHADEVDVVVCSHLHLDHIGGLVHDGRPVFRNATVRFGRGDWDQFVTSFDAASANWIQRQIHAVMEQVAASADVDPIDGDMVPIAPGVTGRFTPGHTLGHYALVLSSAAERAYILGDAVECPLQIEEPDIHVLTDVDPALARRTRDQLLAEVEGTGTVIGAAHFPGLQFGRVLLGEGRRFVAADGLPR